MDIARFSPIWVPFLLVLIKFGVLVQFKAAEDIFLQDLPSIIAFSGFSFITWAFAFKAAAGRVSLSGLSDSQSKNEWFLILGLLLIQLVVYLFACSAPIDDLKRLLLLGVGALFTYLIPYLILVGRLKCLLGE